MSRSAPVLLIVNRTRANAEALASVFEREAPALRAVAACASEATSHARAFAPEIALLELDVAIGIRIVRELLRAQANLKLLVYGSTDDERELFAWAEAGATRIALRSVPLVELVHSVSDAATTASSASATRPLVQRSTEITRLVRQNSLRSAELTQRERDVLRLIALGLSNREVADTLRLELPTVKNHVQHLMKKLGVHRRADAALYLEPVHTNLRTFDNAVVDATSLHAWPPPDASRRVSRHLDEPPSEATV